MPPGIVRLDERLTDLAQSIYDYAWDRWGLYVGTYRLTAISASFGIDVMIYAFQRAAETSALSHLLLVSALALVFGVVIMGLFASEHLRQRQVQAAGQYARLNARSLSLRSSRTLYARLFLLTVFGLVVALNHAEPFYALQKAVQGLMIFAYSYTLATLVRPRNEARFARLEGALAAGGAR